MGCLGNDKTQDNTNASDQPTTDVVVDTVVNPVTPEITNDPYGNIALFESMRRKIKFSLVFVENCYDFTYYCGKWARGSGVTVVYNEKGKGRDVRAGEACTMDNANVDIDRYLTFSCLKSIRNDVKVPLDENTLLTACVIQYCIGPTQFRKSSFLRELNNGAKGEDLVKWLTLYRKDPGVLKRCYFFAAMVCGKMEFSDLLDVRADGCYTLWQSDILQCKTAGRTNNVKNIKKDSDNCGIWNFDNLQQNLEIAKAPRTEHVTIALSPVKKTRKVVCQFVKDIVPDSIWNDVSNGRARIVEVPNDTIDFADAQNDTAYIAYQNGDYENALTAAKCALTTANNSKQRSAACYNIGITYAALDNYSDAIKYLKVAVDMATDDSQRIMCQQALDDVEQQQSQKRQNNAKNFAAGVLALGTMGFAARKIYVYRQKHK
ncbi:MAG: tetratricopeptide repeat protein [Alphaproteobacteria bacterium]|nr:tetratricopeptide repeat protein [Alphaproteobacteria bacterium]